MNHNSEIPVSISCLTYNHAPYIRQAIEGFLMQKTNFPFEVLIHDDASTDGTANIIREYEQKYPDVIRPIYQKENQYSKGIKIGLTFQIPRARGKYIALCEGDDYWIDPYKLQKQFDAMENHPDIDICSHAVNIERAGKLTGVIAPRKVEEIIPVDDVILGGGGFVGTNSLFFRKTIILETPRFAQIVSLDYVLQILGSLRGGMLYLPEPMSVYRTGVSGSWTGRWQSNPKLRIKLGEKIIRMLQILDEETMGEHEIAIQKSIHMNQFFQFNLQHRYDEMRKGEYHDLYNQLSWSAKLKLYAKQLLHILKLR